MNDVKWLLVGAGDIAKRRVAPALVAAQNSRLVAICDINRERASELAARHGVEAVYSDYARALAESGADTVYIATPQSTHIELSMQALAAGKHLLCEKPLGLNGAECVRLLEAARKSDRVTSCSNYRRLSQQYKLTDAMLKGREIGKLVGGWAVYSSPFYNPGGSPILKALGMSRIKELGFYLIDIVQNLRLGCGRAPRGRTLARRCGNAVAGIGSHMSCSSVTASRRWRSGWESWPRTRIAPTGAWCAAHAMRCGKTKLPCPIASRSSASSQTCWPSRSLRRTWSLYRRRISKLYRSGSKRPSASWQRYEKKMSSGTSG